MSDLYDTLVSEAEKPKSIETDAGKVVKRDLTDIAAAARIQAQRAAQAAGNPSGIYRAVLKPPSALGT